MICGHVLVLLGLLALFVSGIYSQSSQSCDRAYEGRPVDGPCGQRCICLNGRMEYCCRERQDFTSMTRSDRVRYVNTVIRASTEPQFKQEYERIIGIHSALFDRGIHNVQHFLPWHRWFILLFENFLRTIDCKVTVPYWDWSLFSGRPWETGIDDIWSSSPWGLGGNGAKRGGGRGGGCVTSGRFSRASRWRLPVKAGRGCLRRQFSANPPDIIAVYLTKEHSAEQFRTFELDLRANLHDTNHCRVGGIMCGHNSASAPEFFLHHAFIDKIWANWQEESDGHMDAYFPNVNGNLRMVGTNTRTMAGFHPREYIDTLHQPFPRPEDSNSGRSICVFYKDPVHRVYDEIMQRLDTLSFQAIRAIPRHRLRPATPRQMRRLGVKRRDRRKARKLLKTELQPRKRIVGDQTLATDLERRIGFRLDSIPFTPPSKDSPPKRTNLMHDRWMAKVNGSHGHYSYHHF